MSPPRSAETRNTYHNRENAFLGHCQTSNSCFDIQEHWRLLWDLKASICWLLLEIQQTLHKLNLSLDHKIRSLCQIVHCTAMINQKTDQTLLTGKFLSKETCHIHHPKCTKTYVRQQLKNRGQVNKFLGQMDTNPKF